MKLIELMEEEKQQGTYAGVRISQDSIDGLMKFMKDNKVPKALPAEKMHMTLLYSRKFLPDYKPQGKINPPYVGTPHELVIWETKPTETQPGGNALVLTVKSNQLEKRHKELMDAHKATYDYDKYIPHITLSYDIGDMKLEDLNDIKKYVSAIEIIEEYSEVLDLDWASKTHK